MPRPLAPLEVLGAVQFLYRGEREAGELELHAQSDGSVRLELRSPLTGGLALEVLLTQRRVRVLDYVNRTVVRAPNEPDVRQRLFAMDLAPDELQTLLTGRVERSRFERGGGRLAAGEATYYAGAALHRFRLGAYGLPERWSKEVGGSPVFHVEFREYLELPAPTGGPLRLPRKVRLYGADPAPLLVLGVREARLGAAIPGTDDPDTLPPAAAGFTPGTLPLR